MDTTNDTTELVKIDNQEVSVHKPIHETKSPDEKLVGKITREGNYVAFDFVRGGLGDRDIYAKTVFFDSMVALDFLEKIDGEWKPTSNAIEKYPLWFVQENETKKWGLRPSAREDFEEEFIYPIYTPMAARVMGILQEEKRTRTTNRRRDRAAKKKKEDRLTSLSMKGKLL